MKKFLTFLCLLALISLTACSKTNVSDAKNGEIQKMTGTDLNKIMEDDKEKENYLVIDVRSQKEYDEGHVKHAININVDELEANLSKIDDLKDKNVVTICNTGKKSQKAAEILVKNGFTKVYNAEGVKEFNYTTITKVKSIRGKEFVQIVANSKDNLQIIDAREEKDFTAGHINNAFNANTDTISSVSTISKDKEVYTYCYSGNRSYKVADKLSKSGFKTINVLDGTKEYSNYTLVK